jgi:hypothetical protein
LKLNGIEDAMSVRTIFLAKLLGLFCILEGLFLITHKPAMGEMMNALFDNAMMLFIVSLIALGIGLALVLGHNIWSGGALPIVVTLIGWGALIKGIVLLFVPQEAAKGLFHNSLQYEQFFYLYAALPLILGAYLTYGGFRPKQR